jgi:hypothetical protein
MRHAGERELLTVSVGDRVGVAFHAVAQGYTLLVLKSYVTKLSPTRGIISAYCAQGREWRHLPKTAVIVLSS